MFGNSTFSWLRRTGQLWKLRAEVWVGVLGAAGVFLGALALFVAYFAGPRALWVAGACWAAYGLLRFGTLFLKYRGIRCPQCGFNPTRQPGSGRWLPEDEVHERLAALEVCPGCGYRGRE